MREKRIRLRHIRTFVEVARVRNATRAAENLHTAQPAVSRTIRELESEIGQSLFVRTPDGLILTEAGARFYHFASSGLTHIAMGIAEAAGEAHSEVLAFGALPNITRRVLPDVLKEFKQTHRAVRVRLITGTNVDLLDKLRAGEIDFVIGRLSDPETMTGLSFEHLLYENLIFAARSGHPLACKDAVSVREIDQFPVVVPHPKTIIRAELDQFMIANGIPQFADAIETVSFDFARPYVLMSDAVVALPFGAMEPELREGVLVKLRVPTETLCGAVGLSFFPGRRLPNATLLLLDILRRRLETDTGRAAS